jgi:hypothetical protein
MNIRLLAIFEQMSAVGQLLPSNSLPCEWPLKEWVSNDGAIIEQELNHCIEDLSLQINKALTEPLPEPIAGFSEIAT